jgi:RNA polymerase sigma-70 factor (ECF subfamily)
MEVTNLETTSGAIAENKAGENKSEAELMAALADRDPDSMEQIYQRYESVLRTVILGVLHEEGDADDVLHDVFLQLWDQSDKLVPERGCMDFWSRWPDGGPWTAFGAAWLIVG